ncbi:MAG TPA: acyl-CoA dehydrogenase [Acidimicrobiales bacterium]|nr:acyl-CoA dehydrogenase [Acidimicrobiales bacterium]
MPIAITDDHQELGSTVRGVLTAHKTMQAARALLESEDEPRPSYWGEMAELGWLGIHLPEEYGGSGAGLLELVVVLDELGRQVAPGPFLPTVLASAVIEQCGNDEQRARLLSGLADGTTTAALGLGGADLTLSGGALNGDGGYVLGGSEAGLLLFRVGDDVAIVEAGAAGLTLTRDKNLDPTRRALGVVASNVTVDPSNVLAGASGRALALARTLGAAEAVGGMAACTDAAVAYAKERVQFGRTIGTFQAIKHHCANLLVAAELATAAVYDAARAAHDDGAEFALTAAMAAHLSFAPYVHSAQMNIQVHGGIGFTWEHDAHFYLRRALVLNALVGSPREAEDVTTLTGQGVTREVSLDLPPEAEEIRVTVRADAQRLATLSGDEQRKALIDSGLMVPHWPRPWGREAGAVEQLVIDEELKAAGVKVPPLGITGWNIMTVNQYATPDQVERWVEKTLMGEYVWCQLFSEPDAGSDAAAVKTKGVRVDGGWVVNGQKVWTSGAHYCHLGLATVRTNPDAAKHAGITTMVIDMHAPGVEVRPLRQITGNADFNEVFFNDVFVPDDDVVGTADDGWTVARSTLGNERVSIGGGSGGLFPSMDLNELLARHGDFVPGASARIGSVLTTEHALKVLNQRRAQRAVIGSGPGPEGNVTKLVLAEHGHARAELQADLVGPELAFMTGSGAFAGFTQLATRAMSIAGGTSEITRNQIAERILGLPRDPLNK